MALTKVSGGILDPGINVAGIVTATGFDGPFIGGSGKNIVAGIITATGLDVNGNGDISGNLVVGGNLTANGDFTTLNTTLREVELLRVDANSSTAAGIITQRGTGNILEFFDTSTNVGALTDEGNLGLGANLTSPNVKLHVKSTATGGGNIAYFDDTGSGNTGRLMILTTGGAATDGVKLQTVNRKFTHFGNNTNHLTIDNNNARVGIGSEIPTEKLDVNGTSKFQDNVSFTTANGNGIIISKSSNYMMFGNSVTQYFGGSSMWLMHNGSTGYLHNSTGDLYIRDQDGDIYIQAKSGENSIKCLNDGGVYLYYDDTPIAETTVNGFQVTNGALDLVNNAGSGASLRNFSAGTFFAGNSAQGDLALYVQDNTNNSIILQANTGEKYVECNMGGSVDLYHHGQPKFETQTSGAVVLGALRLQGTHSSYITGQAQPLIYRTGSSSGSYPFDNFGHLVIQTRTDGSSTNRDIIFATGTNSANQIIINSSGHLVPGTANTYDLGSTTAEFRHLYLGDSGHVKLGSEQDTQVFHDGANFYIKNDTGNIVLKNAGADYLRAISTDSSVALLQNSGIKLETTATGITVTGEIKATQDYPLTKPVLDFNFAAEKKLDPRIQFTRNSIATFIDKKGIVRYASDNQPRFDHHPTSGASLGLLLEQQRTNHQPYSVDMSQGANNNEVTVENNAAIAPDGTMSASKITGGTDQNTSQRLGWGTQGVASNSYTMWSIWLKSEETSCIIQVYSNTYTFSADHLNIELADGTVGGHTNIDGNFRYNLEKYPNKWWRLSWGGNGNAGGNSGGMYVAVVPSISSSRAANTGSAHSKVWYAWGLQEEVGTQVKFASSYIPTNGASVIRRADRGTIDGDDFNDFFDRYQGAVVHEVSNAIQSWTGGGSGWEFNNDNYQYNVITNIGSGYSHNAYPGGYAVIHGENSDSGTNSMAQFSSSSATGNQGYNNGYYAGRYPGTDVADYNRLYKTYTDGMSWDITNTTNTLISATGGFSSSGTNTNNISHRNISKFELGSDTNDMDGSYQKFSGRIKRWMYYDKALTANQLENLTAQDPVTYL